MSGDAAAWGEKALGYRFLDVALLNRALTHSSHGGANYERLEFLGDRVLGLVVARWLFDVFPDEPEGKLSRRLNALVTREVCAEVARTIGVPGQLKLGRQARDDGAADSDNVLGDIVEALIGALLIAGGMAAAEGFIRSAWAKLIDTREAAPKHPKSALQEWAAAHDRPVPEYVMLRRSGPHHAPRFVVQVSVRGEEPAEADGSSKQEAETAAAAALLERLT